MNNRREVDKMKKKLLLLAILVVMPFMKVQAAPPSSGTFGVNDSCKYSFNNTTGEFIILVI